MPHAETSVIDQIRARYPEFSTAHQAVARVVISHTGHCAFLPIARMAEMSGVSAATVVRFAQILGYSGYPDFQAAVQALVLDRFDVNQRLEHVDGQLEGMLSSEIPVDAYELMRTVMIAQAEHVLAVANNLGREEFEQAIERIIAARSVYVAGLRLSSAAATALWHGLHLMRPGVRLISPGSGFLPEQISECGPDDLLLGITFRRYAADTLRLMEFARARGAAVIAITDHRLSPAAVAADLALVAPVTMQLSHIPLAPAMALVSALLECLAQHYRHEGAVERTRAFYQDSQRFHLFIGPTDDASQEA